jgi:hypothetical protein
MKISKINEYSYSYAEYQVSDGEKEIRCVCNSVPLPNGLEPQIGMPIKMLYAFCLEDILIKEEKSANCHKITKIGKYGFQYEIVGTILHKKKSLIKVFDFIISLEYFYPNGISDFEEGDIVSIIIDRIECELDI